MPDREFAEVTASTPTSPAYEVKLLGHNQQRRLLALQRIAAHIATLPNQKVLPHLTGVYQFGVLHGFGLRAWLEAMPHLNMSTEGLSVWGFDSFRGMPAEKPGYMRTVHEHDKEWHEGGLNVARLLNIHEWRRLQDAIVSNIGFEPKLTHLVRGFYNESLREGRALSHRHGMPPALLLDIDCDLYTSTKQALRFMLESRLLVPGTYVYYDDYSVQMWNVPASQHPHKEERLAHQEITTEFGLKWTSLNTMRYLGPMPGMGWIRQWPNTSGLYGKNVWSGKLQPVLRLEACTKCEQSANRWLGVNLDSAIPRQELGRVIS